MRRNRSRRVHDSMLLAPLGQMLLRVCGISSSDAGKGYNYFFGGRQARELPLVEQACSPRGFTGAAWVTISFERISNSATGIFHSRPHHLTRCGSSVCSPQTIKRQPDGVTTYNTIRSCKLVRLFVYREYSRRLPPAGPSG